MSDQNEPTGPQMCHISAIHLFSCQLFRLCSSFIISSHTTLALCNFQLKSSIHDTIHWMGRHSCLFSIFSCAKINHQIRQKKLFSSSSERQQKAKLFENGGGYRRCILTGAMRARVSEGWAASPVGGHGRCPSRNSKPVVSSPPFAIKDMLASLV